MLCDASRTAQYGVPARPWKLAQALHLSGLRDMQAVSLTRRKTPSSVRWQPPAFGTPCAKWTHRSFTTLKDYLEDPTFPILPKAGLAHSWRHANFLQWDWNASASLRVLRENSHGRKRHCGDISSRALAWRREVDGGDCRTNARHIVALRCRRFLQGRERRLSAVWHGGLCQRYCSKAYWPDWWVERIE